ncbi:MAG: BrnT family toxin [Proteobacteria bacterium]|nr:BrnT family toxin [Pseudomonadota bacterium]
MIKFEWNISKARSNERKHGITFEEAKSVFYDELAVQFYDSDSSQLGDDRFLILGVSSKNRILMICHCEREPDEVIRIISARKATKNEQGFYKGDIL